MTKKIIALSVIAAFATASFGADDIESRVSEMETKIKKLEKKLKKSNKKLNAVKAHDAGDNIKWDIDFRTAVDKINYDHASGAESKNDALMTNRLLLGMKYKADELVTFYGALGYNKAYGDSANHSQANTQPGFANFDWVTNENATDNTVKVKEAYWLYMNDTFLGSDMAWTASVGRRPSTGGLGINYREGDNRKSALAHTVNVEFDGASLKWNLDKVTPMVGSWFKLCMGRGLTNANPRFNMQSAGGDYAENESLDTNTDMIGFIFVPYDDGQYSVHTNYAVAKNILGFNTATTMGMMGISDDMMRGMLAQGMGTTPDNISDEMVTEFGYKGTTADGQLHDVGDLTLLTALFKADGIGSEVNDFLDNTTFFASYATSKTDPNSAQGGMLGSTDSQTGNSVWIGAQMPCPLTDDGRFGIEWNKGSKYWRSVTYAEDTMTGSKIATRGTALEVYWLKPLTKALSMSVRYTQIKYDYTGSNTFFGEDGTPMDWTEIAQYQSMGVMIDPVKESSDLRIAMRYKF